MGRGGPRHRHRTKACMSTSAALGRLVPGPGARAPHHLRPPGGESVGGQSPAPPATPRPSELRSADLDLGQLPDAGLPLRPRRPLPAAGWAGRLRPRRGAKQTFYGLRAHLWVCWLGVICDARLVPANLHDLAMAEELLAGARAGRWAIEPTGARPGLGCWPSRGCGCWRRHDRSKDRGRVCPAGWSRPAGGSRR